MFEKWKKKIELSEYFLNNLKALAKEANGFAYIPMDKKPAMRANLDGFFFELISAKDFFLQEINDYYRLGLKKDHATKLNMLKSSMIGDITLKALAVVNSIEKNLVSDPNTWQWQLNNYRNSATHQNYLVWVMKRELNGRMLKSFYIKTQKSPKKDVQVLKSYLIVKNH